MDLSFQQTVKLSHYTTEIMWSTGTNEAKEVKSFLGVHSGMQSKQNKNKARWSRVTQL